MVLANTYRRVVFPRGFAVESSFEYLLLRQTTNERHTTKTNVKLISWLQVLTLRGESDFYTGQVLLH